MINENGINEILPTTEYLKALTGKFNLEIIFILSLPNKGIVKPLNIIQCSNIITLNLSKNKLSSIDEFISLTKMKHLDISFNQIKSVDSLSKIENLISLKAQGNQISKINNLDQWTKQMRCLNKIYFQQISGEAANPICKEEGYRDKLFKSIISLKFLDGTKNEISLISIAKEINSFKPKNEGDSLSIKFDFKKDKDFNVEALISGNKFEESMNEVNKKMEKLRSDLKNISKSIGAN